MMILLGVGMEVWIGRAVFFPAYPGLYWYMSDRRLFHFGFWRLVIGLKLTY